MEVPVNMECNYIYIVPSQTLRRKQESLTLLKQKPDNGHYLVPVSSNSDVSNKSFLGSI